MRLNLEINIKDNERVFKLLVGDKDNPLYANINSGVNYNDVFYQLSEAGVTKLIVPKSVFNGVTCYPPMHRYASLAIVNNNSERFFYIYGIKVEQE